jgi:2,5-diketo-D-gluconate reductase A
MTVQTRSLTHGALMPLIGLGTWPMDDAEAEKAVAHALELGYRLIDTAENYRNEAGVGRGMRASAGAREDIFITTKFNKQWHGAELVEQALDASLQRLGLDYVDLLLIHWPNPQYDRYVDAWRGLARLLEDGRLRAIGTSNFTPSHLQRIIDATGIVPDVNQIQLSPPLNRSLDRAFAAEHDIVIESWSPVAGQGVAALMQAPVLIDLAQHYAKTPAQIVLRWHIQLGLVPIPKSSDPQRQAENLDVFDFALTDDEVAQVSALDTGAVRGADPEKFGH